MCVRQRQRLERSVSNSLNVFTYISELLGIYYTIVPTLKQY